MHIVHIFFAFPTGGAETMLVDIMNEQARTDKVGLVIINNKYDSGLIGRISEKISITRLNRRPGSRNVFKIGMLNLVLLRMHPDLIHCHDHTIARYIRIVKCIKILTVHDVRFPVENFGSYDRLVAISGAVRRDILGRSGIDPVVIHNGIRVENVATRENGMNNSNLFRIVQVGRLDHEKKGQHILLHAVHQLVRDNSRIKVDFIGEGPSLEYLRQLSQDLDITGHVNFPGLRDRDYIYRHLRDYDLLVQPSLYEGFGLTVAEAMAAGVPVLIAGLDGPKEIIENGRYGHFFIPGDIEDCARQISRIIRDCQESGANEMTASAQLHVRREFNISDTVSKYQYLYHSLISRL